MYIKDLGPLVIGQVLFINNTLAVQPEHFTSQAVRVNLKQGLLRGDTKITFVHASQSQHTFEITVDRYLAYKRQTMLDKDVEFIDFEDQRAHRNIERYFLTERQLTYVGGEWSRLDVCDIERNSKILPAPQRSTYNVGKVVYGENMIFAGRCLTRYFAYKAPTSVGDCGAPISLMDNSSYSGHSIFGLHVAGNDRRGEGYCNIITYEMVVAARKMLQTIDDKFDDDLSSRGVALQSGTPLPFEEAGSFLPIGTLDKAIVICPKTSYYPTKMYGAFGEYECLPAPLSAVYRDGNLVYPMANAVKPYSSPVYVYDVTRLKHACHVAFTPLTAITRDGRMGRILTFEEAICGIPERKFRAIPRNTSPGWPYCMSSSPGKTAFFGDAEEYDLTGPKAVELRSRVEHIVTSARNNERTCVLFNDFLKDELRSAKKVEAVATRLISSAPLDYVVAWRMYFGEFSSEFMRNHTAIGMAPGICAYTDWDFLARKLSSKGGKVFAGDFKAFDSSEQPCVMDVILGYINSWYNDGAENARIRRVLWQDLTHSRHIGGLGKDQRHVYQWNKSLPSGHPFTTIVNSMYSLLLLVACYISLTGDWVGFWDKCFAVTYGDDNVVNVSDAVSDKYNQKTVALNMFTEFKMIYTSDDKDGDLIETTDLSGVSFLKRRFSLDKYYYNCPLDLDSFLYSVYWCKNKRLEDKIRVDELENALEELSLHEPDVWANYAPRVYEALSKDKVPNAPLDREAYLRVVRSRSDHWY
jgi:hypothetical protein